MVVTQQRFTAAMSAQVISVPAWSWTSWGPCRHVARAGPVAMTAGIKSGGGTRSSIKLVGGWAAHVRPRRD
eukprot:4347343-Prorocentrum_lima.AAC.1